MIHSNTSIIGKIIIHFFFLWTSTCKEETFSEYTVKYTWGLKSKQRKYTDSHYHLQKPDVDRA